MKTQSLLIRITGLFACLCLIIACDPDDSRKNSIYTYDVSIRNESNAAISIYGYRTNDLVTGQHLTQPLTITSLEIAANSDDQVKRLVLPSKIENTPFIYPNFENVIDSVVVKFNSTNRGYIVKVNNGNTLVTEKWISNKSPLLNIEFQDLEQSDNVFYYKISQQDYENAPEL